MHCWVKGQILYDDFICSVTHLYDYVFAENGLVAYKDGEVLEIQVQTKCMVRCCVL